MVSRTTPEWASRVDALLEARERNRAWLAGKMVLSKSMMTRLMAGERTMSPGQMERIAEILETPVFMIFGPQEEQS